MIVSGSNKIAPANDASGSDWCGYLLNQAAFHIRTRTAAGLAPLEISPPQLRALEAVVAAEPLSQARLGDMVKMDRSTIVHVVDRFEAIGAAARRPDPADRRTHAIVSTAKGKQLLAVARARALAVENEFLAPLSHPEREALRKLLRKLLDPTPCPQENDRESSPSPPNP